MAEMREQREKNVYYSQEDNPFVSVQCDLFALGGR